MPIEIESTPTATGHAWTVYADGRLVGTPTLPGHVGEGRFAFAAEAPVHPNPAGYHARVEDVAVLAELIATGEPLGGVLENWFARREPRVRWVQNQSRRVGKIGQWKNPLACRARNELTRWLPDSLIQRILIRMAEQLV